MDANLAYDRVIRYLTVRAHSRAELIKKLRQRGASSTVAAEAVDRAAALGYVNDAEFARMYARMARDQKGFAPLRIRRELAQRGIDAQLVEEALESEFSGTDLAAQACALAAKRLARLGGDVESRRRKLAAFLERRGYPTHVTMAAVDAVAPWGQSPYIGRAQ